MNAIISHLVSRSVAAVVESDGGIAENFTIGTASNRKVFSKMQILCQSWIE